MIGDYGQGDEPQTLHREEDTVTVGTSGPLLPEGVVLRPFQPVAYYDGYMDCIRVQILDRSITEVRVDDSLTLYRTNHPAPFDPQHVGFSIKGVKHLFRELGLPLDGVLRLTELIDALVKRMPGTVLSKILSQFPVHQLTIEWDPDEARAA
jgi:hypothetical protein